MSPTPPSGRAPGARRPAGLRPLRVATALLLGAVALTGCDAREIYEASLSWGLPEPISEQGQNIYDLYLGSNAAAVVVGVFVLALILFATFRYRKRSDELPRQVRYNLPVEVLYTVVPFVIIAVLFYYTVLSQNYVNELTPEEELDGAVASGEVVNIGVVGFQWNWEFNYTDEDVRVIGETGRFAQLVVPTDTTIRFTNSSPDVIHSFWVPAMLFKRDVIPGRANTYEIVFNKTGEYIGRCAELCGEKHAFMNFSLKVVTPDEYRSYIDGLQADPNAAILTAPAGSSS
ncbi:MAG TPA: cytochrome c oxidase subunit II [Mycobacteriales bacterium]|nr:cytochrome c oxidase subunit II [Mycobacteriales bacterium]